MRFGYPAAKRPEKERSVNSLLMLIPAALLLGLFGLMAFLWALRSGQFDDLDGAANRILFDDEEDLPPFAPPPEYGQKENSKENGQ